MQIKKFLYIAFCILAMAIPSMVMADTVTDTLDSNNKIYVVVLVLATIFAGIILYLIRLDRKISKLEKEASSKGK